MEIVYQKLKVYDTHVEKEFRFNNKSKSIVSIWLKLTKENEFGHSQLLAEDLNTNKNLNKKECKELIDKAINNFYERIIHNFVNINKLFINISYKPENNLKDFIKYKDKKFIYRIDER